MPYHSYHSSDTNLWKYYATVIWFARRLVDGDQWYDLVELYKFVHAETGITIGKEDRQLIFDATLSPYRHTFNGSRRRMPNGQVKSLRIGFCFSVDKLSLIHI